MEIKFEEISVQHMADVIRIERESFSSPWSMQAFTYEILYNELSHYIVALSDDDVVGYGGMWIIMDEAHITNIAVDSFYRGQKFGYLLMKQLINKAIQLGAVKMTLEVRPSNTPARNLYLKLGFEERGIRKNYYSDINEDAIIMWKDKLLPIE